MTTQPLPAPEHQSLFEHEYAHASVAATTTWKISKPSVDYIVDQVDYINVTGLAVDPDNFFVLIVKVGDATLVQVANTETDSDPAGAAIAANTWIQKTAADLTAASRNGAAGDEITAVATKTGTQTLPAGLFRIRGRYLQAIAQ